MMGLQRGRSISSGQPAADRFESRRGRELTQS